MNKNSKLTAQELSLRTAILDLERTAARQGWDRPPILYALVYSRDIREQLAALEPENAERLLAILDDNPTHLTAVMQDQLPPKELTQLLSQIVFGEDVAGVALTLERFVVSPEADQAAPEDPQERERFLLNHQSRQDVRLVVGVTRDGYSWCATRSRNNDQDDLVGQGPDLVPEIIEALRSTLVSDEEISQLSTADN